MRGTDGLEVLCDACGSGGTNAVNALLAAGVDVNCKNVRNEIQINQADINMAIQRRRPMLRNSTKERHH